MVPQPPLLQRAVGPAPAAGEAVAETVQEGVEIVVLDDEHLVFGVLGVVVGQMAGQLQPQGRLARAFFAEHHGRGRLAGIAVDLVPGGMERVADADPFEDEVGLGVLIGERIGGDAVMIEELLDFHFMSQNTRKMTNRTRTVTTRPPRVISWVRSGGTWGLAGWA